MPEKRFFKRNGAKKDPEWNRREKPEEVRSKWVEMMNAAMERADIEERVDGRSYVERGRYDLEELKEPKLLGGQGKEAVQLREKVEELRERRAELPAVHLDPSAAVRELESRAEAEVAQIEQRLEAELSVLDKLIAAAWEVVAAVADKVASMVHPVEESAELLAWAEEIRKASPQWAAVSQLRALLADHKERETVLGERLSEAKTALTEWKKEHPIQAVKSVFGQDVSRLRLEAAITQARELFNMHQAVFQSDYVKMPKLEAKLEAARPEMLQQARRDLKEIAVSLPLEQVRRLIFDACGKDREAGVKALQDVLEKRTSVTFQGLGVRIEREREGLVGRLQSMHQPRLDRKLAELELQEAEKQKRELQREMQRQRTQAKEHAPASVAKLSREELDRQLREIATKAGYPGKAIREPADEKQKEATGRILGYTSGNEEALFLRLNGSLVRLDIRGRKPYPLRRESDINLSTGDLSEGLSR